MSASPVAPRVQSAGAPAAGGPARSPAAGAAASRDPLPALIPPDLPVEPWWTPESLKGWASSIAMHCVLLICMGLWYIMPSQNGPPAFDSRLAGSPNGVPDGDTLAGGLNTPLPMPEAPIAADGPTLTSAPLEQLDLSTIQPASVARSGKSSAGGGRPNDNPGAGDGDGFGLARFGEGGELIRGVQVKVGDPQFTLIWNTDGVDLDLHVIEPGGKEIFWEDPKGARGGELDVDNTKGFGPENIYWLVESEGPGSEKVKGPGPTGVYKWYVVYWGGFGGVSKPTHWQVRVKHAGKVNVYHGKFSRLNERSKTYTLTVP